MRSGHLMMIEIEPEGGLQVHPHPVQGRRRVDAGAAGWPDRLSGRRVAVGPVRRRRPLPHPVDGDRDPAWPSTPTCPRCASAASTRWARAPMAWSGRRTCRPAVVQSLYDAFNEANNDPATIELLSALHPGALEEEPHRVPRLCRELLQQREAIADQGRPGQGLRPGLKVRPGGPSLRLLRRGRGAGRTCNGLATADCAACSGTGKVCRAPRSRPCMPPSCPPRSPWRPVARRSQLPSPACRRLPSHAVNMVADATSAQRPAHDRWTCRSICRTATS